MIKKVEEGSLTVEAALVLPVFLFSVLFFLYFFQILFLQDSIQSGITEAGRFLSRYEKLMKESQTTEFTKQIILKQRFLEYLDTESINTNCVVGGTAGIWITLSESQEEDLIDITAVYWIRFPVPFFGEKTSLIKQRVHTRAFVGKELRKYEKDVNQKQSETDEERMVYVAENGVVYHENENCTHLRLSISKINQTQLETARNADGGKYKACERCIDGNRSEVLYIAREGDKYHSKLSCSGLKRTYYAVRYLEVKGLQKCSRCS